MVTVKFSRKSTGLNRLIRNIEKTAKNRLDVGFFAGQTHPEYSGNLATLAVKNAKTRPFLSYTAQIHGYFLNTDVKPMLRMMLKKGVYKTQMQTLANKYIHGIESTIYSLEYLQNSPEWSAYKEKRWGEFKPPLINTGYMIGHIKYRIK